MSERDPHRWSRFAASVAALLAMVVVVPIGLIAVSRSRFGSASPLAGADPPWEWGSNDVGDALSGPLADDTVIDGIIRLSLCVVWVALAVIIVTTIVEVVHATRHQGLSLPDVRGLGWAQTIARFIAVGGRELRSDGQTTDAQGGRRDRRDDEMSARRGRRGRGGLGDRGGRREWGHGRTFRIE